jgi:hypothetical protein
VIHMHMHTLTLTHAHTLFFFFLFPLSFSPVCSLGEHVTSAKHLIAKAVGYQSYVVDPKIPIHTIAIVRHWVERNLPIAYVSRTLELSNSLSNSLELSNSLSLLTLFLSLSPCAALS